MPKQASTGVSVALRAGDDLVHSLASVCSRDYARTTVTFRIDGWTGGRHGPVNLEPRHRSFRAKPPATLRYGRFRNLGMA